LRSLAATSAGFPPNIIAADTRPDDAVAVRLRRLCALLGVAGARLSTLAEVEARATAAPGLADLEARAAVAGRPFVVADTGLAMPGFYVGLTLPDGAGQPQRLLSLFDPRPRSPMMATTLAALVGEVLAQAEIDRQRRTIADYAALEEQRRSLFDRASATAHIGIWQCNLADNSVTWTNGVYDLFEIPRDTPVTREMGLALYTEASRREMEAARARAIATCSDFALDAEIITIQGKRRWMRLTGAVESRDGVAHRIFGMKQDITEEKLLADRTRYLAEFDVMTGLANRSLFQAHLAALDDGRKRIGALLLVDLDGFKQVNDTYGHAIGDECLKEAAVRLVESCGGADLVARIGGDEFAVLLNADTAPDDMAMLADSIVAMMRRPVTRLGRTLRLGASVGAARYHGGTSESLFRQADTALYAAKAAGRDTSRVFAAT
jgi:diguanylate cyclase (GGDEF)-like protein